jgi:serine/threonine protein phosphatase PrpC
VICGSPCFAGPDTDFFGTQETFIPPHPFAALFDGHGGATAAQGAAASIGKVLRPLLASAMPPLEAMKRALEAVNEELTPLLLGNARHAGCTALLLLVTGKT